MQSENAWQRAADLTNMVLQVTRGVDLPRGNDWRIVVTVFLLQANERLDSTRVLLDMNYWDSAVIVTRSLFELAVNVAYLAKDVSRRLPSYLRHGGIPTTSEEAENLQNKLERRDHPEVRDFVPGRAWKHLKDMCCDLGSGWLKEYETFYRFASVPTHAGSFTLGNNLKQLLDQHQPPDSHRADVLVTALGLHLRVAEVAADVFPERISLQRLQEMRLECQRLGQSLARR